MAFLLAESERLSVGSVKGRVGELRSLLRFLYLQGLTPRPLAVVVPPVAGWRDTGVPKAIPAGDVQRLLDSCDRGDPVGIRDYAILMLVARLGLRSAEVARLELGDIDWRAGQITLRGKACRQDGMPLPCDVGEALAAYLSQARPATPLRQVFLATKAPMRAIPPGLVSDVTHRACDRAGLPRIGAHRLRHTLATRDAAPGSHNRRGEPGAAASRSGHHRHLRQGGLRRLAHGCPALAGSGAMSALADAARDYLRLRNSLGHDLAEYHRELPRFVAFLEAEGLPTVTVAAALAWAQGPGADPATSIAPRRMTIARGFARYLAGIDARTEVPPAGLIAGRHRWRPPFIYSPGDIEALMAQARQLTPMPAATHETLVGLLAVTGLRVGEAIRLDRADIDWASAVLTIRESKFGKTRMVPVLDSTLGTLERYARIRGRLCPQAATASFFVSTAGTRLIYACVGQVFRRLRDRAGIGAGADRPPRIHDLRHTFAVRTLLRWYQAGSDVEARLPILSTYLGHRDPRSTYWYLSAAPELLALAARQLERSQEAASR